MLGQLSAILFVFQLLLCYHVTSPAGWPSSMPTAARLTALTKEADALCYIAQGAPALYSSTFSAYQWRCNAQGNPSDAEETYITGDSSKLNYWCAGSSSVIYSPPVARSSCCYSVTGGDTSIVSTCSSTSGACQWFGITCDTTVGSNTYGSVVGIKLYGISLSGTLSSGTGAFSDLSNLLSLDVSYNRLGQTLPSELNAHATLTKLMINNNLFTGAAPTTGTALATYTVYNYAYNCFTTPATDLTAANYALQQTSSTYCSPTGQPTRQPTRQPSQQPSMQPSRQPFGRPTMQPSCQPTMRPSMQPTVQPSMIPSCQPSSQPSQQPSSQPSMLPSMQPTSQPTQQPTHQPTMRPSNQPSSQPTNRPNNPPTTHPTRQPTSRPSRQPSSQPSMRPSNQPTHQPTMHPSQQPTVQPTRQPSTSPTFAPGAKLNVKQQVDSVSLTVALSTDFSTGYTSALAGALGVSTNNINIRSIYAAPGSSAASVPSQGHQRSLLANSVIVNADVLGPAGFSIADLKALINILVAKGILTKFLQASNIPGASQLSATILALFALIGKPTGQPSMRPSRQPTQQPTQRPSMQPSTQPTAQPTSQPTTLLKPLGFNYGVMAAVCSFTAVVMLCMGIVAYNGYKYPRDHTSCETFCTVYLCYDRYGLEYVKDGSYTNPCPCCFSAVLCDCCVPDESYIHGGDWRIRTMEARKENEERRKFLIENPIQPKRQEYVDDIMGFHHLESKQ